MYKISLIGAGQLGSRHLQALAKTELEISIEVVEPNMQATEIAKQRFNEIDENKKIEKISYFNTIDKLSAELDFVIVATNSNVRYRIVKELLDKKNVKYLLLEKVLFQEIDNYYKVEKLLSDTNTKCWVNHPRRMFPFYQSLKKKLSGAEQISFMMQGGNWGLACNGLHLLDIFSFLSDESILHINSEYLFDRIYDSKRRNFIEFNGTLVGKLGAHSFTLFSNENTAPSLITISSDKIVALIDEVNGFLRISTKENNWKWENYKEKIIYYQSELTHQLLTELFITNKCNLPTYKEAMRLHVPFIQALLNALERIDGKKHKNCPIT